jgi:hypothetical protein
MSAFLMVIDFQVCVGWVVSMTAGKDHEGIRIRLTKD